MARFIELAELFEKLEKITSHKESAYLFLGSIGPAFENTTLGVGDKIALKAIASAYRVSEEEVKKRYSTTGDLGDVAFELSRGEKKSLTIDEVFGKLREINETSGKGSQEEKVRLLSSILQRASPEEGKYIVRIVLGKLRLETSFCLKRFLLLLRGIRNMLQRLRKATMFAPILESLQNPFQSMVSELLGAFP